MHLMGKKEATITLYMLIAIYGTAFILFIGWIVNIVRLIGGDWCACKWTILRIIGIFAAPVGGILGFIP